MIKQWSYSRVALYQGCPQRAKFKVLDRLPDPAGPAADRGTYWHKVCEDYVGGKLPALPAWKPGDPKLVAFVGLLEELKAKKPAPALEQKIGLRRDWTVTDFFAKDVWGRSIADVMYYERKARTVYTIDWKTGKPSLSHHSQLELYNAVGLILHPQAVTAVAQDVYLDIGPQATLTHSLDRRAQPDVLSRWKRMAQAMEDDKEFKPTPSAAGCKWCPYAKNKGGQCAYTSAGT